MSEIDIPKGAHWPKALGDELANSQAGIICVTCENQDKSWLLFEAGALARNFMEHSRVCVILIDLEAGDISSGPLSLYQAAKLDKEDIWRLILSLNNIAGIDQLDIDGLRRSFQRCWPKLRKRMTPLRTKDQVTMPETQRQNMLEKILSEVRRVRHDLDDLQLNSESVLETEIVRDDGLFFGDGKVVGRIDSEGNVFIGKGDWLSDELIGRIERKSKGCFLSTACCSFMGLPDDCPDLNLLREFRDEFLSATKWGRLLVEHYYRVAPLILAEIHRRQDREVILHGIYTGLVAPSVKKIRSGNYGEAICHYSNYTRYLGRLVLGAEWGEAHNSRVAADGWSHR